MNKFKLLCILVFGVSVLSSCLSDDRKYVIGVSQCSEDSWRTKLEAELEQSTYFHDDVELVMSSANDDIEEQKRDIDSLINERVDLLIVSPQQVSSISGEIKKAIDAKIPVILFDRKSDAMEYSAFMGANNYNIGALLADYAASQLGGKGNIVEIGGEHGSSPAIERHKGFNDALKKYPGMKVIGFVEGNWKEESGEKAMQKILETLPQGTHIDCVFGGNDRMALGAHKAMDRFLQLHSSSIPTGDGRENDPIYLGIDALPTPGGGIELVRQGVLKASAIYPTHGGDLMELALAILKGEPYEKTNDMETSLVTIDNANVLLMQHKEVVEQDEYIKKMHAREDSITRTMNVERYFLWAIIVIAALMAILFAVTVRANNAKHKLIKELQQKNDALNREKEIVERQRDELEENKDLLLDATEPKPAEPKSSEWPTGNVEASVARFYPTVHEQEPMNDSFYMKFMECIDNRMADSELSVEDIGRDMCLSRVQLYRKVKALTGKTPVEIIREARLKRAHVLLQESDLSVSEVAYKVGFSAPSYFAKCYKNFYGKAPSDL